MYMDKSYHIYIHIKYKMKPTYSPTSIKYIGMDEMCYLEELSQLREKLAV